MPRLERPVLAVDVVLLCVLRRALFVALHPRTDEPFPHALALPGVAVRIDETLLDAARRALLSKCRLSPSLLAPVHLEQVATFDALYRDPRGRTISVVYMGLCREPVGLTDPSTRWTPVTALSAESLPFDHHQLLDVTVRRLAGKLRYTNIAARLLAETFRIDDLQTTYEAVLGRPLNRANFRTKLLKIGLIERVGVLAQAVGSRGGRPPHLYRFKNDDLEAEDRDFV